MSLLVLRQSGGDRGSQRDMDYILAILANSAIAPSSPNGSIRPAKRKFADP